MRILTFTSLFPNAIQPLLAIFIHQRTSHLARLPGNTVDVIAPVPYFPRWIPWGRGRTAALIPRVEKIGELTVYHPRYFLLPKISMPIHGLLMFLGCASLVRQLHEAQRFDCIDAHFIYPDGFAACLLGKLCRVPVVVSARGTDLTLYPSFRLIRPLVRWTLRDAAGLIAVSASLKAVMIQLGAPSEKIRVISNGVDIDRFYPENRLAARQQLGLLKDAQIIVSVGSLLPVKCHELLILALARMKHSHPKLKAYIIGEGVSRPNLEAAIREAGLEGRVVLVGSRPNEELRTWFSAADASCLVSSREGWPNVLSESIACGTPAVATKVGGVPEIISSADLGILVEPNVAAITAGLESALTTPWNREALAQHGRARTWELVAKEIESHIGACTRRP